MKSKTALKFMAMFLVIATLFNCFSVCISAREVGVGGGAESFNPVKFSVGDEVLVGTEVNTTLNVEITDNGYKAKINSMKAVIVFYDESGSAENLKVSYTQGTVVSGVETFAVTGTITYNVNSVVRYEISYDLLDKEDTTVWKNLTGYTYALVSSRESKTGAVGTNYAYPGQLCDGMYFEVLDTLNTTYVQQAELNLLYKVRTQSASCFHDPMARGVNVISGNAPSTLKTMPDNPDSAKIGQMDWPKTSAVYRSAGGYWLRMSEPLSGYYNFTTSFNSWNDSWEDQSNITETTEMYYIRNEDRVNAYNAANKIMKTADTFADGFYVQKGRYTEESWNNFIEAIDMAYQVALSVPNANLGYKIACQNAQGAGEAVDAAFTALKTSGISGKCGDNITWTFYKDGELEITGTGDMYDYTSSSKAPWYSYWSMIKTVTIADGVTSIGSYAFCNCENLTSVTIGNGVTSIGEYAFYFCRNLVSVTMSDGILSIGNGAFENCNNLAFITFPDSVTSIGDEAFSVCKNLTSVAIPASVTNIGFGVFSGCVALTSITVESGNEYYCNDEYGVLFNKDKTELICCPGGKEGCYTIPDGVTSLEDFAFYQCENLTSIIISDSVTSMGVCAFAGCTGITSIVIPDNIENICDYAFMRCENLISVTIPDSVTSIGANAFSVCTNLNSVELGNSVTSLGTESFSFCTSLVSINIPDSVENIGDFAFISCSNLESVTIGNSVTSIGFSAFADCTTLTSVTIGNSVTSIDAGAFAYCNSLTSVTIPDSVTSIGEGAFVYCTSLTDVYYNGTEEEWNEITIGSYNEDLLNATIHFVEISTPAESFEYTISNDEVTITGYTGTDTDIVIPSKIEGYPVTSIGNYAFKYCDSLTSVTIGDSVTSIGDYAFFYCDSLTSVTIGDSVTGIDDYAFRYCDSLTDVYYNGTEEEWNEITIGSYNEDLLNATIHFAETSTPAESFEYTIENSEVTITKYIGSDTEVAIPLEIEGYPVTSIGDYAFSDCTSLTSVTIPDSVTSIGDYAFYYCESLTSVTIPDSVISIGDFAFVYCSSLTSVTIGNSVTSIGSYAFSDCYSLTSVTIPDSVTSIGSSAFEDCASLTSVTIPDSVTSIGDGAFAYCDNLTSVTIGNSVTSIGYSAFYNCYSLTSVTIGSGVTSIGGFAFAYCDSLTSVVIPDSVTSIGSYAFEDCDSLTSITVDDENKYYSSDEYGALYNKDKTVLIQYPIGNNRTTFIIPDSVTSIVFSAFEDCDNLTSVTIPDSVTSIGRYAFAYCDSLTDVYYNGTEEEWNKITIASGNEPLLDANIHFFGDNSITVSGVVTSFGNEDDVVTITLTLSGATEPAYTTVVTGLSAEYFFKNVDSGTYTMTVSKADHTTCTYEVTVDDKSVTMDVEIHLLGDINGDGRVNTVDTARANTHSKGISPLDDYQFACADINGDGKVNAIDVAFINAHAKGVKSLW